MPRKKAVEADEKMSASPTMRDELSTLISKNLSKTFTDCMVLRWSRGIAK